MDKNNEKKRGHAIALFSGGLDSTLAVLLVLRQNIEVTALTFMTHFGCDLGDCSSCGSNPYPVAEKYGFNVKLMHLGQKFVDIVKNPKHGRGKNMNPCTDCRILMLNEGKELMEMLNADFIFTGEVLGQRPMSQVKDRLNLTERETGLSGKLVRPLSAKLLKPTDPELSGLLDRDQLEDISGRSRKRQIELAEEFGLQDYPAPASGCLLTDENYSKRLRDLLAHTEHIGFDDLNLLRVGRHFRLDKNTKVIVGRNEPDNLQIMVYRRPHHFVLEAVEIGSPTTLLIGDTSEDNIKKAAMITARYSADKKKPSVKVTLTSDDTNPTYDVPPADDKDIALVRV